MEDSEIKKLVIIGASGHGKVVADIAKKNGYREIQFLDDNRDLKECCGYGVVGGSSDYIKYDCDMIVAIGNPHIREKIQKQLDNAKKKIPVLIHPKAAVGEKVLIGKGTVIMAGAVVNSDTEIGRGCIVNTCASVDHDCRIGAFVHVSVGGHVAGNVYVGDRTWIGIGAVVSNNISVCEDCMIGAGAVIVKNIKISGTYIGVPAEIRA